MALVRDMIIKRPPSLQKLIAVERFKLNLKAVKKVTIEFDPFRKDVQDIRHFSNLMYAKKTLATNTKCIVKTNILTDRSEHSITFDLIDGQKFVFKCANLRLLEIYQLMNKYLTPLAPPEEEVAVQAVQKLVKKR